MPYGLQSISQPAAAAGWHHYRPIKMDDSGTVLGSGVGPSHTTCHLHSATAASSQWDQPQQNTMVISAGVFLAWGSRAKELVAYTRVAQSIHSQTVSGSQWLAAAVLWVLLSTP